MKPLKGLSLGRCLLLLGLLLTLEAGPVRARLDASYAGGASPEAGNTYVLDRADWDRDGDPRLPGGNAGAPAHAASPRMLSEEMEEIIWASPDTRATWATAWGDVDGDGDLDLIVGNNGVNQLYINDGGGNFAVQDIGTDSDYTLGLALGDMDGDGDLDLAVANSWPWGGQPSQVWANDGQGSFTLIWEGPDTSMSISAAWGDIDNDGDLDLAWGNDGPNEIYQNDGAGNFTLIWDSSGFDMWDIETPSVAWGDVDGDGVLELVVGNRLTGAIVSLPFENQIYDFEFDASSGPDPALISASVDVVDIAQRRTNGVALGDVDGDGDLDLLVGNEGLANQVYVNDGTGSFTILWETPDDNTATQGVALGDMDVDGDLDLVFGNKGSGSRIYANDGAGDFTLSWQASGDGMATEGVALGDADGDGDLDMALGNYSQINQVYANAGGSGFAPFASIGDDDARDTRSVAIEDIDNDGDLDFAVANWGHVNQIYRNDGGGHFSRENLDAHEEESLSVAWGDMDGDGDPDLVVGNSMQPNRIYRNDGTGHLTLVWSSSDSASTRSVAWGDMDGDGDLDLAVGNYTRQYPDSSLFTPNINQFYRNDGGGDFTVLDTSYSGDTSSLAWGDLDNDGDQDLVVGNYFVSTSDTMYAGKANLVCRNNGSGEFTVEYLETPYGGDIQDTLGLALADVNDDGLLDIAAGNTGSFWQDSRETVYLNTGGGFDVQRIGSGMSSAVVWADVDGDGDSDLVVGNDGQQNQLYRTTAINPGSPPSLSFAIEALSADNRATSSIAAGDLDGDGDLDLIVANASNQLNQLYRNDGSGTFSVEEIGTPARESHAIAWGDADGDGDLDLAIGISGPGSYQANHLYRNDGGGQFVIEPLPVLSSTLALAWGDADSDGDLDLLAGNENQADQIWLNDGSGAFSLGWETAVLSATRSAVWGDVDGDGDLDWVAGNATQPNQVYVNQGGVQGGAIGTFAPGWASPDSRTTRSVAWGDVDGDGDLDLAVGNEEQVNQLFLNDGSGLFSLSWESPVSRTTRAIAWGDTDGDGDLDLIVGNYADVTQVYENRSGTLSPDPVWSSPYSEMQQTTSLAVRDVNGDGRSDFIVGNDAQPNQVYLGGGSHRFSIHDIGTDAGATQAVALGDADGDGDMDLSVANSGQVNQILENVWGGRYFHTDKPPVLRLLQPTNALQADFYATTEFLSDRFLPITYQLTYAESDRVGWVEVYYAIDGGEQQWLPAVATSTTITRHLETSSLGVTHVYTWDTFASGFFGQSDNVVLRIVAYPQPNLGAPGATYVYSGTVAFPHQHAHTAITTFPFRVRGTQVRVLDNGLPGPNALVYHLPSGQNTGALPLTDSAGVPFRTDAQGYLQGRGILGLGDTLVALRPIRSAQHLRFDGLDDYVRIDNTIDLANTSFTLAAWVQHDTTGTHDFFLGQGVSTPNQGLHVGFRDNNTFTCDFWNNGLTTSSAYPDIGWHHWVCTYNAVTNQRTLYRDGIQVAQAIASADYQGSGSLWLGQFPSGYHFKGALDEVRIYTRALAPGEVARLAGDGEPPATGLVGYWPFDEEQGSVVYDQTTAHNDGLISDATWEHERYTLYHTNAAPTETGLDAFTVTTPGVQALTVSADKPLLLFDLDVSLEWDARQDTLYLDQLAYDLQRASEFLYDWTNGQVALGQVHVYHDHERWDTADLRIYASNRMRPSAIQGGVTRVRLADPDVSTLFYEPGLARLGASWSRYGETGGSETEDWPRALAHELGHYLLYLDDNYLGFDAAGQLIPIDTCTGAMADPYRGDYPYDEFHAADAAWTTGCAATLSQQRTGRADWATVQRFYPQLNATVNAGPVVQPLDVTRVQWHGPVTPTTALADPTFHLVDGSGARLQPGTRARAFLFQDDWLTDLGTPHLDQVRAHGARVGDRLCVLQADQRQVGCEVLGASDRQVEVVTYPDWQPDIIITPITSRTLTLSVTQVLTIPPQALQARLYAGVGAASAPLPLTLTGSTYQGVFTTTEPAIAGYVHVWDATGREALTDYALGGNPAPGAGAWSGAPGAGAWSGVPTMSSDGQVILYGQNLVFPEGEFYALQATTTLPATPAWATVMGQAYRLLASGGAPALTEASISFQYLGSEVPDGEESWLAIHYWDGSVWQKLPTVQDTDYNTAAAPAQGPGLYALMASLEIPLPAVGWNLFAYPVEATRPVTEALLSISGYYTTVYGYESGDPANPWRIYDKRLPAVFNTLETLAFGQGYWISVTQAITLNLAGPEVQGAQLNSLPLPPATYYGPVLAGPGFAPAEGLEVSTWVGETPCGTTTTRKIGGQVMYLLHVEAACSETGEPLRFEIAGQELLTTARWSNAGAQWLPLGAGHRVYLPAVLRE